MVLLDRALVSSYRLSIVTMSLTAAVWPQFELQVRSLRQTDGQQTDRQTDGQRAN